jgi:hypothetical protein
LEVPPPTAAGQGQQQALQGEHLDVELLQGQPLDGVYHIGGEDQELVYYRFKATKAMKQQSKAVACRDSCSAD